MRTNVDGSEMRQLPFPDTLVVQSLSISPKGTEIGVCYQHVGNLHRTYLWLVPSSGRSVESIQTDGGSIPTSSWSPDGDKLYFGWVDMNNIYGQNAPCSCFMKCYIRSEKKDGTSMQTVSDTASAASDDIDPAVSPDGTRVVFASTRNYYDNLLAKIFTMTTDGKSIRQLTSCAGFRRHGDHFDSYTDDGFPFWTQDGKHIVFQREPYRYDHGAGKYKIEVKDLHVMNPDGTGLQNLTNDGISSVGKQQKCQIQCFISMPTDGERFISEGMKIATSADDCLQLNQELINASNSQRGGFQ
jgi:Tol biopolymer transport system component